MKGETQINIKALLDSMGNQQISPRAREPSAP